MHQIFGFQTHNTYVRRRCCLIDVIYVHKYVRSQMIRHKYTGVFTQNILVRDYVCIFFAIQ